MKLNFYAVAVWWQNYNNIEYWVKHRGVNVLMWDKAVNTEAGDWEKTHQIVEVLRRQGYNLWVIRQPAYLLVPDKLSIEFDQKWKSHLLAFGLDDEFEDKIPGGNIWTAPQPIVDYVKQRVTDYKKWMPDIPIFANFNGTHPKLELKDFYANMVNAGIDIICSDNYPIATQQIKPDGTLLAPNVVASAVESTRLFKQWFPDKSVWTFLECCNQDIAKNGDAGWEVPWKFVGSRAPTPLELWQMVYYIKQYGGDGIAWFPQAHNGAINDATPPELIPILLQIAQSMNPGGPVPPQPVPNPVPVPPAKKLIGTWTISCYSDGTCDVRKS